MKKLLVLFFTLLISITLVACGEKQTEETRNIKVYTRDTTSGTREAFMKGIGFNDAIENNGVLVPGFVEVDGNSGMIAALKADDWGLGYISLSSLDNSGLTGLKFDGVEATEANVLNDTYGLKRPFNYIIRSEYIGMETEGQIVEAFIAYMGTTEGKLVIANKGGIVNTSASDPYWDDIKGDYSVCSLDNSNVTINFGGSTSVKKIAEALSADFSSKCGNFIADHNHTGSGDGYKRTQGSEKDGADKLHIGFASRGIKVDESEPAASGTYGQLCWDAVVAVVNNSNSTITDITAEQLKKMYDGTFTKWEEVK